MTHDYLFAQYNLTEFIDTLKQEVAEKVNKRNKGYLLTISETDLCEDLVSRYRLYVPVLQPDKMYALEPEDVKVDVSHEPWRVIIDRTKPFYVSGTTITIVVPFDGEQQLFDYGPSTFSTRVPRGEIVDQELHLVYTITDHDAESLQRAIDEDLGAIEAYLQWMRKDVESYNDRLPQLVQKAVQRRKEKLLADEGLVSCLRIPVRRRSESSLTFMPPEIRRKPALRGPQATPTAFHPEAALAQEEYEYILKVISDMVHVMERSRKTFASMAEEDLRNVILVMLNGHYEGQATGETFNCEGRTDILIRHEGRNVFIAECMFWDGAKSLRRKLDQLLGYTSWRDTKTALVVFSRRLDFSAVLAKISGTVPEHGCYKRDLGQQGETQFRYVFHQPGDKNRELFLTVLAFSVPSSQADVVAVSSDRTGKNTTSEGA